MKPSRKRYILSLISRITKSRDSNKLDPKHVASLVLEIIYILDSTVTEKVINKWNKILSGDCNTIDIKYLYVPSDKLVLDYINNYGKFIKR